MHRVYVALCARSNIGNKWTYILVKYQIDQFSWWISMQYKNGTIKNSASLPNTSHTGVNYYSKENVTCVCRSCPLMAGRHTVWICHVHQCMWHVQSYFMHH